jgi:alpha-tubulin suppressor-like RCC1 family protein
MNVANLIVQLQKAALANNPNNQMILAKSIELLRLGHIKTVENFAQLPSLQSSAGEIYYVLAEGLFWNNNGAWRSLAESDLRVQAWSWGLGTGGQLGDGSVVTKSSPVSVFSVIGNWQTLSGGSQHSIGLTTAGTIWAWGTNSSGQLGDGTTVNTSSPVSVVGGITDWCQVSAGQIHNLGLTNYGEAWAWGSGANGRLGDNSVTAKSSPVLVVGGFTDWCQIAAGSTHSLGLRTNGTVWAWGSGVNGRLGDDTTISKLSPVSVVGGFTDWSQVSAGIDHSLAVRQNGTVWAWGYNGAGRLGDNSIAAKSSPVSVVGDITNWCQASAGGCHSLAVTSSGEAWAWGSGANGRVGDGGALTNKSSPVSVAGGFTNWCRVSASRVHSLGLTSDGIAWAWGTNTNGQLGDGTSTQRSSPVSVGTGIENWCWIASNDDQSLGITATGLI